MGSAASDPSGRSLSQMVLNMRASLAAFLSVFLTLAPLAAASPALAAERRMTGDEIRDIARR